MERFVHDFIFCALMFLLFGPNDGDTGTDTTNKAAHVRRRLDCKSWVAGTPKGQWIYKCDPNTNLLVQPQSFKDQGEVCLELRTMAILLGPSQDKIVCDCVQAQFDAMGTKTSYRPQCDKKTGAYKPKQCTMKGDECWCVDKLGHQKGEKVTVKKNAAAAKGKTAQLSCGQS